MFSFWKDYYGLETQLAEVQQIIDSRLRINSQEIASAVRRFAKFGGKLVRPALFLLFAGLGGEKKKPKKPADITKIAASLELLHLATLIHDDIIDDADMRRKAPTVQSQLGKDTAVYAGDFVYTAYFELLTETLADTPFLAYSAVSMKKILNGELTQKALLYQPNTTIQQYLQVIKGKTAELISLACVEGAYFGGLSEQEQRLSRRIGRNIGLAFQIYDDLLNFSLDFENEKPILTDVTQGVYTLPLLIAKQKKPAIVSKYLERSENLTRSELIELAQLVKETGALADSLEMAKRLTDKALADIEKLPDKENRKILAASTRKLLKRAY